MDLYGIINSLEGDTENRERTPTIPGNYLAYYDNIYEHLRHGSELAVKADEARNVIRIIEASYESSQMGSVVRI